MNRPPQAPQRAFQERRLQLRVADEDVKDVSEEDHRRKTAPPHPLQRLQEILRIPFHLAEMSIGEDGHAARHLQGLREAAHSEILPAAITSGTPVAHRRQCSPSSG